MCVKHPWVAFDGCKRLVRGTHWNVSFVLLSQDLAYVLGSQQLAFPYIGKILERRDNPASGL